MSKELQKSAPAWHAKAAAEINREAAETNELDETARRRRARLGLMLIWVKAMGKADGSIPHGMFGPWLEINCKGFSRRFAGKVMGEGMSVCELLNWQIGTLCQFETPPHKLLAAKSEDLKGAEKQRHDKLIKIIDEQSHFAAVTKYKQVELKDDVLEGKVGRRKGEGGNSREQRAAHKIKLRAMDVTARKHRIKNIGEACEALAEDAGMVDPEIADERAAALPQIAKLYHLMMKLEQGRGA